MTDTAGLLDVIRSVGGDPADLPFWQAVCEGQFLLHHCGVCGRSYWPASRCVIHGDQAMAWRPASGLGQVYTFTILHHAFTPAMIGKTPYVVAVVRLDEGPFFHSNILGCSPDAVFVGMPVKVDIAHHGDGFVLPMFRPIEDPA